MYITDQLINGVADLSPAWRDAFRQLFIDESISAALVFAFGA
jgi:hypothetical protein